MTLISTAGVVLLCSYLLFVLEVRWRYSALILLLVGCLAGCFIRRSSSQFKKNLTVLTLSSLVAITISDIVYSIYLNIARPVRSENLQYYRFHDPHVWPGELDPRAYYPTERNFQLRKPNTTISFDMYGGFFRFDMFRSATLVNSVLELRRMSFAIDENGFRETTPLHKARVFVLGDSFAFGTAISQDKTWVELLDSANDTIYNLAIPASSPKQQLMALEYMLRTKPLRIEYLLWMLFEGNDLEDSYETFRPNEVRDPTIFKGTVIETVMSLPVQVKRQSVINRLLTGGIVLSSTKIPDPFQVDGITLEFPLFHSDRFGYRLFHHIYAERAGKPMSYIMNHPNLPRLQRVFEDMAALAAKYSFRVTVIVAPSAARLYRRDFRGFPKISDEPHFTNYIERLSSRLNFKSINLLPLMQKYADKELLHWRDDVHWNERGNQVVAEILASEIGR